MSKHRFHPHDIFNSFLVLTLLLLISCGGGGGFAGGGIGGTGVIASGPVTTKGSVHVNGAIYNTDTATFTLDGSPGSEGDIRRGMVVRVDGVRDTATTGTANTVAYEDVVKGPLTNFSTPGDIMTLTVLGQTVIVEEGVTYVDDGTVLAPNPLPQILPDFSTVTALEISGLRDATSANGVIRATYIEIKTGLTNYEVKGVIENDPTNTYDFKISGLGVDFSGTIPAIGESVEVKGLSTGFTPPDELVATSVETRTAGLGETEVDHAEVEGFVTSFDTPANEFKLNGQAVNYAGANFEGGTIGDLVDGVKIEAEGSISGGILIADKIKFKESIRFEGNAINVNNPISSAMEIEGLEGVGLVIFIDSTLTEIEDVNGNPGTIASISDGYELKIRGRDSTGGIVATRIKVISITKADIVSLQGPATSVPPPANSVEILNSVTVDTSSALFKFFDATDTEIISTQFYALLEQDNVVKAKGDLNLGTSLITWNEIQLEN